MSLVTLAHTCAHLQNCTRVRLSLTSIPYSKLQLQFAYNLYKQGYISSLQKGSTVGPDKEYVEVTPDNISTRRLWLGLKYRENKPILNKCQLISKPSLRIILENNDLKKLCSGTMIRNVKPLQPGELILVRNNDTIMDINEAVQKKLGGEVLCRIG
ncbi:small ribosomal subunit protein uS8m [Monosporozyma unispora]|nr:37S ribosomal protein S8, mitochondrial [Kazachstania unispora]